MLRQVSGSASLREQQLALFLPRNLISSAGWDDSTSSRFSLLLMPRESQAKRPAVNQDFASRASGSRVQYSCPRACEMARSCCPAATPLCADTPGQEILPCDLKSNWQNMDDACDSLKHCAVYLLGKASIRNALHDHHLALRALGQCKLQALLNIPK